MKHSSNFVSVIPLMILIALLPILTAASSSWTVSAHQNETSSVSDCRCTPIGSSACNTEVVTSFYFKKFNCMGACCYPQFSVQGVDGSVFQVWVLDETNFALFSNRNAFQGFTSSTTFVCWNEVGYTAPVICPSGGDLYIVVVCKNAVASCRLAMSFGVRQFSPVYSPEYPGNNNCQAPYIMALVGIISTIIFGMATLIFVLKLCKQKKFLCWSLKCCAPSPTPEPFQTFPLDEVHSPLHDYEDKN